MKKKITLLLAISLLAMALTACNTVPDDVTASSLMQNGIPRDKTMYANTSMTLESNLTIASSEDDTWVGDTQLNATLTAELTSDPTNKTSCTSGIMNIKTYGMDMDYPILTYSQKDMVYSHDTDTHKWYSESDPNYVTDQPGTIIGLTEQNFKNLQVSATFGKYILTGTLDTSVENPVMDLIASVTEQTTPSANIKMTMTFDKKNQNLKEMKFELDGTAKSDDETLTVSKFEYTVTVSKYDAEPLLLPEYLAGPQPDDSQFDENTDVILVMPDENEDGDLTFVIE